MTTIEIVSPLGGKGLGRTLTARAAGKLIAQFLPMQVPYDEQNSISIGAVLYNDDGSVNKTAEMVVTATDTSQNKTMVGTGTKWGDRYVNDVWSPDYYYPFDYWFKTTGDHTITFTSLGISESITINVPTTDTRPN